MMFFFLRVSLVIGLVVSNTIYPEVIPGAGLPSLDELGLEPADLFGAPRMVGECLCFAIFCKLIWMQHS